MMNVDGYRAGRSKNNHRNQLCAVTWQIENLFCCIVSIHRLIRTILLGTYNICATLFTHGAVTDR